MRAETSSVATAVPAARLPICTVAIRDPAAGSSAVKSRCIRHARTRPHRVDRHPFRKTAHTRPRTLARLLLQTAHTLADGAVGGSSSRE